MVTYRTPGVYVEEIATLPPSVAEVSTAVPAFIGYTEKGPAASDDPLVARVDTLLEYESIFGGAKPSGFAITIGVDPDTGIEEIAAERDTSTPDFLMHYCLSMYFKNGGGSCYIVSVGNYKDTPAKGRFTQGEAG